MSENWSSTESDWQGIDNVPTLDSHNLVESGGVALPINYISEKLFGKDNSTDLSFSIDSVEQWLVNHLVSIEAGTYIQTFETTAVTNVYTRYIYKDGTIKDYTTKTGPTEIVVFTKKVIAIQTNQLNFVSGGELSYHWQDTDIHIGLEEKVQDNTDAIDDLNGKDNSREKTFTLTSNPGFLYPQDFFIPKGSYAIAATKTFTSKLYIRFIYEDNTYIQIDKPDTNMWETLNFTKDVVKVSFNLLDGTVNGDVIIMVSDNNKISAPSESIALLNNNIQNLRNYFEPYTRTPIIFFRSDDGYYNIDSWFGDLLNEYGLKCAFAVPAINFEAKGRIYIDLYKQLINQGHCVCLHGYNHEYVSQKTDAEMLLSYQLAIQAQNSVGLHCKGFVDPGGESRTSTDIYLKSIFQYAIGSSGSPHIHTEKTFRYTETTYETSDLNSLKSEIDLLVSSGSGVMCIGAHAYSIGLEGRLSESQFRELCAYIKNYIDNFQLRSICPDDAFAELPDNNT